MWTSACYEGRERKEFRECWSCAVLDGTVREGHLEQFTCEQRIRGGNFSCRSGRGQRKCKGPRGRIFFGMRGAVGSPAEAGWGGAGQSGRRERGQVVK